MGVVEGPDHGLELVDDPVAAPGGVAAVGGQIGDRVVAPVVAQAELDQAVVVHEVVDGHQLDGGDPQLGEMLDHGRVGDGGVGAPLMIGDVGVRPGQSLDVGFVDDGVGPQGPRRPVGTPVEGGVDDDGLRHRRRRVAGVDGAGRRRPGRRSRPPGPIAPRRRRPWRTGRAGAWPGCSAAPPRAGRARGPGSRNGSPAPPPRGGRASSRRRPRAAGSGSRCRCRRDTAPPPRLPGRRPRSWCRDRRTWRRAGRARPGTRRGPWAQNLLVLDRRWPAGGRPAWVRGHVRSVGRPGCAPRCRPGWAARLRPRPRPRLGGPAAPRGWPPSCAPGGPSSGHWPDEWSLFCRYRSET